MSTSTQNTKKKKKKKVKPIDVLDGTGRNKWETWLLVFTSQ